MPTSLDIGVGGFGNGMRVWLDEGGLLRYEYFGFGASQPESSVVIAPDPAAWDKFRRELDRLDVWNWNPHYEPPGIILDGTSWGIEVSWNGDEARSGGSNAFPEDANGEKRLFSQLCSATSDLVGGLDFG